MGQVNYQTILASDGSIDHYSFASSTDGIMYFVNTFQNDILTGLSASGIYFAVLVAMCCQESYYGSSTPARVYYNFIGIHNTGNLPGASGIIPSGSHLLASFNSPLDCFQSYINIFRDPTKKYISKGVFAATSPYDQLKAIAAAGYNINPTNYYNTVSKLIANCLKVYSIGKIS